MSPSRFSRLALALFLALALAALWLGLPRGLEAAAAGAPPPPRPRPDDFQALVRRVERAAALRRPQGGISLHFDVDAMQLLGRVPAPLPVAITMTRQGAAVLTRLVSPILDGGLYLYAIGLPNRLWYDDYRVPRPGDVLWVRQGAQSISLTIPALTAYLSAPRDVLTGSAPLSAALSGYLFPYDDPAAWYTATATAAASGAYTLTWAGRPDVRPRDRGYLRYALDGNRSVYREFIAPFLRVHSGGLQVDGMAAPDSVVQIETQSRFCDDTVWLDAQGLFSTIAYPPYWEGVLACVPSAPGDVITAITMDGQPFSTTVQTLTAQADGSRIYGEALPGARLSIRLFHGWMSRQQSTWEGVPRRRFTVTADASGAYSLSLPLKAGDYGYVLLDNPDGHQSFDWFAVPAFRILLGWHPRSGRAVYGQVNSNAPLTVSVRGPSGYLKAQDTPDVADNGVFPGGDWGWWRYPASDVDGISIETGDRITLTQAGAGTLFAMQVPTLTLEMDAGNEALFGQAPPAARLTLFRYGGGGVVSAVVTASLTGTYRLPLSAFGVSGYAEAFSARWSTPQGHVLERPLDVLDSNACPRNGMALVGGNLVGWHNRRCSGALTVRLLAADGTLKAEAAGPASAGALEFTDADDRPLPILGGDVIEFDYQGERTRWEVPPLSARLDSAGNRILGTGVPGRAVSVLVSWPDAYWNGVVTPTASGAFTVALPLTLTPGTRLMAALFWQGVQYEARDALPAWDVRLVDGAVSGILPPLTPYTLTYRSGAESGVLHRGYADSLADWNTLTSASLQVGDVLTLELPSRPLSLSLPLLTALLDARRAAVSGRTTPGAALRIDLAEETPYGGRISRRKETAADADGWYRVSFPEAVYRDSLSGVVRVQATDAGTVSLAFRPPRWEFNQDTFWLHGIAATPGGEARFSWLGAAGEVYTATVHPSNLNGGFSVLLPRTVQAGDRLVVTDALGTVISYTVPAVTAEHDYRLQALVGEAPPGAVVEAVFFASGRGAGFVYRRATADASGRYGMDTSDLRLRVGGVVSITVTDRGGNTFHRTIRITGYRVWLPLIER